ncbi:MAG: hypothetical protein RL885_29990 [Planctomycetota bacterium]
MSKKKSAAPAKKPLWMKLLIVFGILGVIFFVLFWVFLYSPFEGTYEGDLTTLIPPDVHFLIEKTGIEDDFEDFPEPAFWDRMRNSAAWQEALASQEYRSFQQLYAPEQQIADLRAQIDSIPLVSFDKDVIGQEAVISGKFRGQDLENTSFLIATRVSPMVKITYELLAYDSIRSMLNLPSEDLGEFVQIQPPLATTPYYVHRDGDLVLLSNDRTLIEESLKIKHAGPQESLAQTPAFSKRFTVTKVPENYADFYALAPQLISTFQLLGDPKDRDQQQLREFFFRLLNPESFESIRGFFSFDNPAVFQGIVAVDERRMTPVQRSLADGKRFPVDNPERGALEAAAWFPQRTAVFSALNYQPSEFLNLLFAGLHPDTQKLLRDVVSESQGFNRVEDLSAAIGRDLGTSLYFGLFPREDVPEGNDPSPHLLAIIDAPPGGADRAAQTLNDYLETNHEKFGNDKPETYTLQEVRFKRVDFGQLQPGQPLIVNFGNVRGRFVLTTDNTLMDDCIKLSQKVEKGSVSLARTDAFRRATEHISGESNFFLFLNGRPLMKMADQYAFFDAARLSQVDQKTLGAEIDAKLRRLPPYSQYRGRTFPPDIQQQFTEDYNERFDEEKKRRMTQGYSQVLAEAQAGNFPWQMMRGVAVSARLSSVDAVIQAVFDWKF